jgi:hypothetical protein
MAANFGHFDPVSMSISERLLFKMGEQFARGKLLTHLEISKKKDTRLRVSFSIVTLRSFTSCSLTALPRFLLSNELFPAKLADSPPNRFHFLSHKKYTIVW